jgi:hypothetical protein
MPRERAYEAMPAWRGEAIPAWRGETALELEGPYAETFEGEGPASDFGMHAASLAKAQRALWRNGAAKETDPSMHDTLKGYWMTVLTPDDAETAIRSVPPWPWSAAFISWVVRNGGGGSSFTYATAHRVYTAAAKQARQQGDTSKFWAYRATEPQSSPRVGDIIVKDRGPTIGTCGGATYDNIDNGNSWDSHGDLVVDVTGNTVSAIGGNLGDTVGLTPYTLDSSGLLIKRSSDCGFIAVLRPPGPGRDGAGAAPPPPPSASPGYPSTGGDLRSRVDAAVRQGRMSQQIGNLIMGGLSDEIQLSNSMFYAAHPELPPGYQIKSNQTAFAQEWLRYRDTVRSVLNGP